MFEYSKLTGVCELVSLLTLKAIITWLENPSKIFTDILTHRVTLQQKYSTKENVFDLLNIVELPTIPT
jgi:hypothetical protein